MPKTKPQLSKPRGVTAVIKRGGASSAPVAPSARTPVMTYWPPALLARVDALVAARELRIPRQQWIMEAILAKLSVEEQDA